MSVSQSPAFLQRLSLAYPRLVSRARLQVDKHSGKPILLYPEGAVLLNATGEAIIRLCDGTRSFREMLSQLATAYNAPAQILENDVSVYLQGLHQQSLIELTDQDQESDVRDVSRE